jgi:hypothetical protein
MVKTQQLMRFEMYTIPALDDAIRGFGGIFCHLRSRVNQSFLTLVANWHNCATNEVPEPTPVAEIQQSVSDGFGAVGRDRKCRRHCLGAHAMSDY